MEILVLSREKLEQFKSDKRHIIISITDPDSDFVNENPEKLSDILRLQFHDVDKRIENRKDCKECGGTGMSKFWPNINGSHCYACTDKMNIILFDKEMAKKILHFVETYIDTIDLIIVQCEAGISRSSAVAGALSYIYNSNDDYYFQHYLPNRLVYRTMLQTYMESKNA